MIKTIKEQILEYKKNNPSRDVVPGYDFKYKMSTYFTIEEAEDFLVRKGYKIVLHSTKVSWDIEETDMVEQRTKSIGREEGDGLALLALKEDQKLPERNDSKEAKNMYFDKVFKCELKFKLLNY
jgi:hypothetical protein